MLVAAVTFAVLATLIEVTIVRKIPFLFRLVRSSAIASFTLSFVFTSSLALLFGAEGVTLFMASTLSAFLTWVIYRIINLGGYAADKIRRPAHVA